MKKTGFIATAKWFCKMIGFHPSRWQGVKHRRCSASARLYNAVSGTEGRRAITKPLRGGYILLLFAFITSCDKTEPESACQGQCNLEPNVGMCNAAFPKYYYDKTEKKCKVFTWGGCGGVVPFETLAECEACDCK